MNQKTVALLNKALNGCKKEEALQAIRKAADALEEEIRLDVEHEAMKRRLADQPFEGGAEWLRHFPR